MDGLQSRSHGAEEGSLRSYLAGLVLSLALTFLSFGLVVSGAVPKSTVVWGVMISAILQILVHLRYFLHLRASEKSRWNLVAIVFSALVIFIMAGGTVWIMVNLRYHMMPV